MFTMWWAYFDHSAVEKLNNRKRAFVWGYGHFFIFFSIAMIGASLAAAVDVATHQAHISDVLAAYLVIVPLLIYSASLWLLHEAQHWHGISKWLYPLSAAAVLTVPLFASDIGYSIFAIAIIYAVRLILSKTLAHTTIPTH